MDFREKCSVLSGQILPIDHLCSQVEPTDPAYHTLTFKVVSSKLCRDCVPGSYVVFSVWKLRVNFTSHTKISVLGGGTKTMHGHLHKMGTPEGVTVTVSIRSSQILRLIWDPWGWLCFGMWSWQMWWLRWGPTWCRWELTSISSAPTGRQDLQSYQDRAQTPSKEYQSFLGTTRSWTRQRRFFPRTFRRNPAPLDFLILDIWVFAENAVSGTLSWLL